MDPVTLALIMANLGGLFGDQASGRIARTQQGFNQDQSQFNPMGFSGPGGGINFGPGGATAFQTPGAADLSQGIQQAGTGFAQGAGTARQDLMGFAGGALQNQDQILSQQMGNTAFGGLGGLANLGGAGANFFGGQAGQGFQDQSGGAQNFLFGQGAGLLNQAGQTSGLVQQNLDASRALAAPFEQRQRLAAENSLFGRTGGATTGSRQEFSDLLNSQNMSDQQRIMNAQQLGLQNQGQLGQLGLGAFGQGTNLFGQNLGLMGQNRLGFQAFAGVGAGAEGQQFGQNLQGAGFNRSSGQMRLNNMTNFFGLGEQTGINRLGAATGAQGSGIDQQTMFNNLFLGGQGAEAGRISAQADFAPSNAQLAAQRGEASQGFFNNLFGGLGGLF